MYSRAVKTWIMTALTLLVMTGIFLFSGADGTRSGMQSGFFAGLLFWMNPEDASFLVRKTAHFTIYLVLGLCMNGTLREWGIHSRSRRAFLSVLLCFLYACSDEWHQTFVSGRAGQIRDVLLDTAGSLTGTVAGILIQRPGHRRRKNGTGV